jgi:MoxR-like ATPase
MNVHLTTVNKTYKLQSNQLLQQRIRGRKKNRFKHLLTDFCFRPTVKKLRKPASKALLDQWAAGIQDRPIVGCFLTLDELSELQTAAANIKISEEFLSKFGSVWEMLEQRNISISDRRRVQILKFLKAWAIVQGDEELSPEHMHKLCYSHCVRDRGR